MARQVADCERLAERKGWQVAGLYVDDDVSAWSGKKRPEYARVLAELEAGSISGLLVYDLDRLHRQPSELEAFIDLCQRLRLTNVASVSGDIDLTTAEGQFQARILGAVAKKESDDKSRRISRKHLEIAERGGVSGGGSRPYGYEADKMTIRPAEAAVVADCAKRLLAGEPVRSIARRLNEQGVPTSTGGEWSPQSLRRILASPRISGQRAHHGEIVAQAEWPGIISAEDGAKIRALLANPDRRTNKTARRYLLGGLLVCSHCGEKMVARPRTGGKRRYACASGVGFSGCGKTYINADEVEQFVTEAVLHRLDSRDLQRTSEQRQRQAPEAERWLQEADAAQQQLEELATAYGLREITMVELRAARKPIEQRLTAARKQLAKVTHGGLLDSYVGHSDRLRADWDGLDLSQQHAIVAGVLDSVRVGPARKGYNRFDESRLEPVARP